ncbi:MAG TPA: response regulator transcription factor [Candidatus Anoxymicrobiaceae bacterium]|jgi:two-component system, OmpR family, response regulator RegX3
MKKILIIEDEVPLAEALKYTLGKEGYGVGIAHDGAAGLEMFRRDGADLLILDLMLPSMDGLEICRRIRADSTVPIIMVTAKDSEMDEIVGLEIGADDYVTKPFNMRTLITRVRAVLRRQEKHEPLADERIACGDIIMDGGRHEVTVRGAPVQLTPTEYGVLELLIKKQDKVVSRRQILNSVWGDYYGSGKTLDVHVRHLREKIEEDPARPSRLLTVRGAGYKLAVHEGGEHAE